MHRVEEPARLFRRNVCHIRSASQARWSVPRLLHQVREAARLKHLSRRTGQGCVVGVRRHVLFHGRRHPREIGAAEVRRFLSHLATQGRVAASPSSGAAPAGPACARGVPH